MVDNPSYIDVNIFIYWLGNHPQLGQTAHQWIKKIETSTNQRYLTSSLTLYETTIIIAGLTGKTLKDQNLIDQIINALTSIKNLIIEPLQPADFPKATNLMRQHNIDLEDAIHLAVAMRKNAHEIISNDKDFDNTPLKRTI
jgi:predicted nucleic acid-binding protein